MGAEEKEITFYSDDRRSIRVTNTRLMVGNTTYAMANITSVSTSRDDPSKTGAVVTIVLGVLIAFPGFANGSGAVALLGVLIAGVGVLWARSLKPDFHLRISSAAGESSALDSKDKAYIEKVVQAIHEALIHRG